MLTHRRELQKQREFHRQRLMRGPPRMSRILGDKKLLDSSELMPNLHDLPTLAIRSASETEDQLSEAGEASTALQGFCFYALRIATLASCQGDRSGKTCPLDEVR